MCGKYEFLHADFYRVIGQNEPIIRFLEFVLVKKVSKNLRCFSAGFTLDTYTHVTTESQVKAANTMSSIMTKAIKK